jgi:hypothetical protein
MRAAYDKRGEPPPPGLAQCNGYNPTTLRGKSRKRSLDDQEDVDVDVGLDLNF